MLCGSPPRTCNPGTKASRPVVSGATREGSLVGSEPLNQSISKPDRRAAIIYAAKSTADVRGSIPTQIENALALAEREGRKVIGEPFRDEGKSGYSGSRGDGLAQAKQHAERLAADGVDVALVVQHTDRLARGDGVAAQHLVEIAIWAKRAGVRIASVQDPSTFETGYAFAAIMGDRNHEDSRRKALAVAAGLRRAAERGEWPGGILADGYRPLRDVDAHGKVTRRIERDPDRWWIMELIFDLALRGWSNVAIQYELGRRGARTRPRKSTHRPRPFDANRVGQTLDRPCYAGLATYKGEIVGRGQWPAVVSPEDFERLRKDRRERGHVDQRRETGRPPQGYVLARVAACGRCGAPVDVVTSRYIRRDGTRQRTYVCRTHRERPQDCPARPIDAGPVDISFVNNLTQFLGDVESWRGRLVATRESDRARMQSAMRDAEDDVARHDRILANGQRRYSAALEAGDDARADAIEDALAQQRVERERALIRLTAARDATVSIDTVQSVDPLIDFYNGIGEELTGRVTAARGDIKRLNVVVRDYFARVTLRDSKAGVIIQPFLSAASVTRVLEDPTRWPHSVTAVLGGHAMTATGKGEFSSVVAAKDAAALLSLKPGDDVQVTIEVDGPAAVTAHADEALNPPPLRAITVSTQNASSPS
ncbi:MAG: Resolvase domain protein [Conexibacter sp.]|nr:Resolvase domain protein [Conexibacter sp.]